MKTRVSAFIFLLTHSYFCLCSHSDMIFLSECEKRSECFTDRNRAFVLALSCQPIIIFTHSAIVITFAGSFADDYYVNPLCLSYFSNLSTAGSSYFKLLLILTDVIFT